MLKFTTVATSSKSITIQDTEPSLSGEWYRIQVSANCFISIAEARVTLSELRF